MPKTLRNVYYKYLTFDNLMKAHKKSQNGKTTRKNIVKFNLKQEEYIMWLYERLMTKTYKHGGYTSFYVTEPKLRKVEASAYIDRVERNVGHCGLPDGGTFRYWHLHRQKTVP